MLEEIKKPVKVNLTTFLPDILELCLEEMECFGFNPTEVLVNTKRGYIEAAIAYKEFQKPTVNRCTGNYVFYKCEGQLNKL